MSTIAAALQAIHARIDSRAKLLAVSKKQSAESVRLAYAAGQRVFGESYVQEALAKMEALSDLDIEWHFIGPIQSNKTRLIAENFDWVHTVDREKIALRLSEARPGGWPPLQVCIQVNLGAEESKSGIEPESVLELAKKIRLLPGLELRGLMAIPEVSDDASFQRMRFAQLRQLKESLLGEGIKLDTLSMGMSNDLECAIMEGATIVRVGSAIFGARK